MKKGFKNWSRSELLGVLLMYVIIALIAFWLGKNDMISKMDEYMDKSEISYCEGDVCYIETPYEEVGVPCKKNYRCIMESESSREEGSDSNLEIPKYEDL